MTCRTCQRECQFKPGRLCYECNKERTKPNDPEAARDVWLQYVYPPSPGKGTKRKRRKKRKGGSLRRVKRVRFASRRR